VLGPPWALGAALAAEPAALRDGWERHRAALDTAAAHPLAFDDTFWARVASGEVGRRRDAFDGVDRIVGLIHVPADRDTAWVAIQDPHAGTLDGFVEENLADSTFDRRVVYQRISLPWPLQPRQWVVEVQNNARLREATAGAVWERTWTLSDRRGAAAESPSAVWLPANEGGWYLVDLGAEGTLVGYHVRTAIGGVVPDEAAVRWSYGAITKLLTDVRDRAQRWVPGHYGPAHAPVLRPDHSPIPAR
jgi:hypothetical protein